MADKKTANATRVAIAVAVIGAVATVGAALVSNMNKARDRTPLVQQTASGAGAVNVGRDAIITNIARSAGEEAAERVQACEGQHGMKNATEKKEWMETTPARNGEPEALTGHIEFRSCVWPKPPFADGDGFLEIRVSSVAGPGESEASGEDAADRITAPCQNLTLSYQYGHMGDFHNDPPFTVSANNVVTVEGNPWMGRRSSLPFYPGEGEVVVLRNGHYGIGSARCQ